MRVLRIGNWAATFEVLSCFASLGLSLEFCCWFFENFGFLSNFR